MKKAKIALVALATVAVVGGGLAFKAQKFIAKPFYYSTNGLGKGNLTISLFSTTTLPADGTKITTLTTAFNQPITTLYLTSNAAE